MSTELVLHPRVAQWTVEAYTRLLATYAIIVGVFVLLSDERRFSAPQYATTLQLPGFPEFWGAALIAAGGMALIGSLTRRCRWVEVGSFVCAVWELFFAGSVLHALIASPEASPTAFLVHGLLGICFVLSAVSYRQARAA